MKRTKVKWVVSEYGVDDLNGDTVFEVGCGCCTSPDINKYDKLLISKAPEMLQLLESIMETHERYGTLLNVDVNEIRELIKKATEI